MTTLRRKQISLLAASTLAFTVCFMVWTMFGVIGVPIKRELGLSATEFGLLVSMPVLTGALLRLPVGMWTDRYGGRIVFFILMLSTVVPIWLISYASEFWHFLVLGLFVGAAGGSVAVGAPYVARWFDKQNQGFAMGLFGVGNVGAAVTKFVAPALLVAYGWAVVPQVYAISMLLMAVLFWFTTYHDPKHLDTQVTWREQLAVMRDPQVWRYCQYYSIVFGAYVALALWMTQYYIGEFGLSIQTAALLAAAFSLPGGILRAVGGWLSDKYGAHKVTWWVLWVSWICLFLLSYPATTYTIQGAEGPITFTLAHNIWTFTILLFVLGIASAFGKASVFKYCSDDYPQNMGVVLGMVAMMGALAAFLLPIMFGILMDLTGIRSTAFMLLFGVVWVSLIWMYWTEVRGVDTVKRRAP
ncbi:MAG: nitrate/nitrite transporter [Pseudomonadota bacterium]|jgi:NNP family nitrate/nitrite transporter-like MFS transporter